MVVFSREFCSFVRTAVASADAAQLLLVLASEPLRWWDALELGCRLRAPANLGAPEMARDLERFVSCGLAVLGPGRRVQYRPASEQLAAHVRALGQAYHERPVALYRMPCPRRLSAA